MPASAPVERLQPCLFDRLIDDAPDAALESRNQRIISLTRYREGVLRDLVWLLNASVHPDSEGLDEFPEVEKSVFNYGKTALTGLVGSGLHPKKLEADIARAVKIFEPRVIPETLVVRSVEAPKKGNPNLVAFEIQGELWAQPFPEKLFLKTALDVENGTVVL